MSSTDTPFVSQKLGRCKAAFRCQERRKRLCSRGMQFKNPEISLPSILDPGSCQAESIGIALSRPMVAMTMTREESELKQLAYERERARWRKQVGVKDTL